jgi:N-acetylglucosaminyldiphosphoundecaprenol N-acetyl-beta-D-mannosaminyltransferase
MIAEARPPTTAGPPCARRRILGIRVDDVTWPQALALLDGFVASGQPHSVVTPNPEIVMAARRDAALASAIEAADLAPADGVGLRWAGRVLAQPIRQVVPGSDLVVRLAVRAAAGQRWFLLGGAPGAAEEAGRALRLRNPGLVIAGTFGGAPEPAFDDRTVAAVLASAPVDVLLVAYGAPGQEIWITRNMEALGVPLTMGVGGTFNFLAGRSRVPPAFVRRANAIWLFRLVTEPWRWRRQLALVRFVGAVLAEAASQRRGMPA